MSLTLVVGGQYGGEGKGSITAYLANTGRFAAIAKTGGPNSGHSYGTASSFFRVRMVPSGANLTNVPLVFPAGCLIHIPTLFREVEELKLKNSLMIHPLAGIVTDGHADEQSYDDFYKMAGSTLTGTGAATSQRAKRRLALARDYEKLSPFLSDTTAFLEEQMLGSNEVLVEGAQGFGLSNYHGDYPFVSSRDCTAGAVLSQLGMGHQYVGNVVMVMKCFPTRNSHGQGALPAEIDLTVFPAISKQVVEVGGGSYSGGDSSRRVAFFDFETIAGAVRANTPTALALTGLDHLIKLGNLEEVQQLYGTPESFIQQIETRFGIPVCLEARGPLIEDIDVRHEIPR
jgi:adenylosuccinate synthase